MNPFVMADELFEIHVGWFFACDAPHRDRIADAFD